MARASSTVRPLSEGSTTGPAERLGLRLLFSVLLLVPVEGSLAAQGPEFTIDFRALDVPDNPHPPIPQCQVEEEDDPPYPDSTGDCLHGLATSNGQPIECIEAGVGNCPVLTIGVPGPGLMFAHVEGLGIVDYDTQNSLACPLNCSNNWLPDGCDTPGEGCFCQIDGCAPKAAHEDFKDGLDFTYGGGMPSGEEFRIRFGVPTLLSGIGFWRAGFSDLSLKRTDCPAPLVIDYREGEPGIRSGDGLFTFPGGGLYLPPNASLVIANPGYRPFSTNDRIALQEIGVETVNSLQQERWRTSCPYFAVPFDFGLNNITNAEWQITDDDPGPTVDIWRSTSNVAVSHCGLDNLTGGAAGAVCFQSDPGRSGFDTSLRSRSIDLSAAAHPVLRFTLHFQRDDELLEIYTSTDGGTTWDLRRTLDQNHGSMSSGAAVEVSLTGLGGAPDVQLRFRYHDPSDTDSTGDRAVIDDILIYSDDQLFADGFESGNTSAWI